MSRSGMAAAAAAAVLIAGCTGARLEDEWAFTLEQFEGLDLEIVDSFPADDADGITNRIEPYVLYNRPLTREERGGAAALITDLSTGREVTTARDSDSDGMGAYYRPAENLDRGRSYRLDVLPGAGSAAFSVILAEAWNFNMSSDLDVLQFGGSPAHPRQLNDLFVPGEYPLWAMQLRGLPEGAAAGSPQTVDLVFAPARHDDEGPPILLSKEHGYVGRLLDVTLAADGTIDHRQDGVFLPLWSADDVILLYLEDLHVTGRIELGGAEPAFEAMTLSGVLGTRWLLQLREAGPGWRNAVGVLELDIDTNGNDVPDAATFTLSTRPTPLAASALDF